MRTRTKSLSQAYGVNGQFFFYQHRPVTTGNAFADLLLGNISSFTQEEAALKMHEQYSIFEPYFQDDWHVTTALREPRAANQLLWHL